LPFNGLEYDALKSSHIDGVDEGIKRVAANLKKDGMPIAKISQMTGLSEQEVESL